MRGPPSSQSPRRLLRPPSAEVLVLGGNVLGEAGRPLARRALVPLGDAQTALRLVAAVLFLLSNDVRRRREILGLLARPHVMEIHRRSRAPEPPRHGVVRARGLVRGLVGAEADALAAVTYLRVIRTFGARADAAVPRARDAAVPRARRETRHGGGSGSGAAAAILGADGQISATRVPSFFFGRITPCTTFQLENSTVQPSPVGPNISLWVANGHLHGNCYRPTCSGCRSPITTNGPFCSCNFGPFLMKHRSYEWQKKKTRRFYIKVVFIYFELLGSNF